MLSSGMLQSSKERASHEIVDYIDTFRRDRFACRSAGGELSGHGRIFVHRARQLKS
jgi:hypothetical protein